MASYGPIYEFAFDSQNGADILIVISKKEYVGDVTRRPLGRAPILKRENNGRIYGTSLEIYAECKVDGEYAEFYTSSADEFKVEVYKDGIRIWSGFISPELYSEPDIAPPYDVQIIATDGLGELKNFEFINEGAVSVYYHLLQLFSHTGLDLEIGMVSDLRYYTGESASDPSDIFDFRIDLSHEAGESCYDVLQHLLSSLNASITQHNDRWFIFRETDFIGLASADGLKAFAPGGSETFMDIALFGSAKTCQWWPVGQLSSVIEPAKNRLTLTSPNNYKENVLDGSWAAENGALYDEDEAAYILPDEGSYITQKLDFAGEEVGYRLALRVSARNVGSGDDDQALGVRVVIDGRSYAGARQYWLIQPASSDRGIGSYLWKTSEGTIEAELAVPSESDTSADAQDIDIILPLYRNDSRSYIYAQTVEITVFNPSGIHDIYVYGVSLSKYDQFEGYQANVVLDNAAREEGSSIDLSLSDGSMTPVAGNIFMSGIPLQPESDEAIISWGVGSSDAEDYISLMSKDYSRKIALPRMSYKGVLNVPRASIPALFVRDNTYYFPRTYTYDLFNDELEVSLISIPAADLSIGSIQVGQIAQSQGVPSAGGSSGSGSGGGGGIGGGVDLTAYAKQEDLITLSNLLASMWSIDADGNLVTDKQVIIKNNLIVKGDTASGGEGGGSSSVGIQGIVVNGTTYRDTNGDGLIDLGTIGGGTITEITSTMITEALGYVPANSASLGSLATKDSLVASDIPDLSGKYLPLTGGILTGILSMDNSLVMKGATATASRGIFFGTTAEAEKFRIRIASNKLCINDKEILHSSNYYDYALPLTGTTKTLSYTNNTILVLLNNGTGSASGIRYDVGGSPKAYIGYDGSSYGASLYSYTSGKHLGIKDDGTPYYDSHTLYHSGNFNPANYLPLSGGTINGALRFGKDLYQDAFSVILRNASSTADYGTQIINAWSEGETRLIIDKTRLYFIDVNGTYNTLLHSGNVGDYALKYQGRSLPDNIKSGFGYNSEPIGYPHTGGFATFGNGVYGFQIMGYSPEAKLSARGLNNGIWTAWKTIAFTDSTVDKAKILVDANNAYLVYKTSAGNLYVGDNIYTSGDTHIFGNNIRLRYGESESYGLILNSSGNVTIGASDFARTSAKLWVDGKTYTEVGFLFNGDYGIWKGNRFTAFMDDTGILYNATRHVFLNGNILIGTTTDAGYKLDVNGNVRLGIGADESVLLYLNSERPWGFVQVGTGAAAHLSLRAFTNSKSFFIQSPDGDPIARFFADYDTPIMDIYAPLTIHTTASITGAVTMASNLSVSGVASFGNYMSLPNNTGIYFYDASGTMRSQFYVDPNNDTSIGYGAAVTGGNTRVYGKEVVIGTGTSRTDRLIVSDSGAIIKGNLVVQGDISA